MRTMPNERSSIYRIVPGIASSNDGQPQCESNFVALSKSFAPQARQWYVPFVLVLTYSPVNGASVPDCRSTRNSAGDSRARHSSSVCGSASVERTWSVMAPKVRRCRDHDDYRMRTSVVDQSVSA